MSHAPRALRTAALLIALSTCLPALRAADAPPEGLRHALQLASGPLSYRATWSALVLKDARGAPQATISSISFVRDDVVDTGRRPVLFAFNGGPGSSSSMLHTGLLGPRITGKLDAAGKRTYVDNPDTLLDAVDIVLIDPVGTGFNRELKAGGAAAYWNVDADARAAETLIRAWLKKHRRTASPVYIAGESYGGYRLATMSQRIADLNIQGLVLISPVLDMSLAAAPGNDQAFILELPSMAAAAWRHGKLTNMGSTVEQIYEEARAFAQSDYAVALQSGNELSDSERQRIAARMSALIGLPSEVIAGYDLRVPTQDFLEQLVPGKIVGRVDTRVTAANRTRLWSWAAIRRPTTPRLALARPTSSNPRHCVTT